MFLSENEALKAIMKLILINHSLSCSLIFSERVYLFFFLDSHGKGVVDEFLVQAGVTNEKKA